MFELVVHHRYASGTSEDLSGHGNRGHRSPEPGTHGAALETFDGRRDRVVVLPSLSLSELGGVRASARITVGELGQRRTIMEGYLAFAFYVDPDGSLGGGVYTGLRWGGVVSAPGAVPVGRSVDVSYLYDGRDTSALSIDGEIVASHADPLGMVGGVAWPYGLNIGAWPDADLRVFKGRISEIKLWRLAR